MDPAKWTDLVVSLSFGTVFVLLIKLFIRRRSLLELYFSLAALIITIPYLFDLFQIQTPLNLFQWGKLVSVTIYISGLLVLIRESKPIFARFPVYLTALPFVSFLFFPLIIDSIVIKDLINAIYQGGALIVTVLVFALKQAKKRNRRYYIIGITGVATSYLSYWLIFNRSTSVDMVWVSEILLCVGILFATIRFIHSEEYKN
ncbi:MAG: hypothetical protein CL670_10525 [Balneola sp.]|jgi:hypothetical protein|nr:hypothetical protein [Balneola sp.]MBE79579.1 hypothetical protein [Balneola sp.]|tara:strand:- start:295 stop:900 length:606 start_codon:yes stop_codon:yes gene_type:complete